MIKLEKTKVYNMDGAIRGMRNAMASWEKSDSYWTYIEDENSGTLVESEFFVGEKDMELAMKLCKAGSDHRKFLRQIFVSVDITAPLYWWKEFDTYKVGTVANSCSTMHRIHATPITMSDFSHEKVSDAGKTYLGMIVEFLEIQRQNFVKTGNSEYWDDLIQILPTSYNQMRTITLNYENLRNIYHSRKNHKLTEWHDVCKWIDGLPYSCFVTGENNGN